METFFYDKKLVWTSIVPDVILTDDKEDIVDMKSWHVMPVGKVVFDNYAEVIGMSARRWGKSNWVVETLRGKTHVVQEILR